MTTLEIGIGRALCLGHEFFTDAIGVKMARAPEARQTWRDHLYMTGQLHRTPAHCDRHSHVYDGHPILIGKLIDKMTTGLRIRAIEDEIDADKSLCGSGNGNVCNQLINDGLGSNLLNHFSRDRGFLPIDIDFRSSYQPVQIGRLYAIMIDQDETGNAQMSKLLGNY